MITANFRILYCLFLIRHHRREIVHLNVTDHPTGEWVVQQLREAFPENTDKQNLIFDTKTQRTRTISLPPSLTELLAFHRESQDTNRKLFGPDYRADLDLVFCNSRGDYLNPDSVSSKACLIARKAGFGKGVSLHTLRHSHASQLLSSGVSLPTVSKQLGHTDVHTTATLYSHALLKDDLAAAELWEAGFQKATERTSKGKAS